MVVNGEEPNVLGGVYELCSDFVDTLVEVRERDLFVAVSPPSEIRSSLSEDTTIGISLSTYFVFPSIVSSSNESLRIY
jgi:hypothetical protein